jgi:hypothetical protein
VSVLLKEDFLGGRQWKEQCSGLTGQYPKSKALVKSDGLIVLGIHQKRESGGVRLQGSAGGIGQERGTQASPLKSLVHGQPPYANGGHCRIARQTPGLVRGQISEGDAGGGDRVISGNVACGGFDGYEAISDPTADVLIDLSLKITIKCVFAAVK